MKLCDIIPVVSTEEKVRRRLEIFREYVRSDVEVTVVDVDGGVPSIESEYDEAVAIPWILKRAESMLKKEFDALIIDCSIDPGVNALREVGKVPIIGPGEASMAISSILADRFSIVTVVEGLKPVFQRRARTYGLDSKLASVRSIEIHVLDLEADRDLLIERLLEESRRAQNNDDAQAIMIGCTGITKVADEVQDRLNIPVVDPTKAAIKMAEILVDMNLSTSRLTYPEPSSRQ